MSWTHVCTYDRLPVERGVAALVDGEQVALFRLPDGTVSALGNADPYSGAMVLSRGIVGSRGERPTVASPMYKQAFDLRTGMALDDPATGVPVHEVRVTDGQVEVRLRVREVVLDEPRGLPVPA